MIGRKLTQFQRHSMKRSARRHRKSSHRECFKVLDDYEEQVERILAEREDDRTATAQLIQELNAEKAREISSLHKFIAEKDAAVAEVGRLKKETSQLRQQLESTNTTLQDQVAWDDIQPVLHQTHGELISAASRFANLIDSLQNKRLASFLPSTEVFHGNWATTGGPSEPTDPSALPGFSGSSNPPLFDPQALTSTNEYGPFA
ncbi:hypothetical protein N7533_010589 [Penicillium manginii]|uniref:uncharacterized protein n=1 Tax=Penicillium manginii TaxID=203109 RepID=UPI0025480389|nr:uncharacterized protein N7533_010589 [Penicillium manginii]KAJ5743487.1 hypothetical protein N7533_010589 [Penicillium manginii]